MVDWLNGCLLDTLLYLTRVYSPTANRQAHSLTKPHEVSIALLFEGGSFSKEIEHLYNRRTDNEKEEKGNQALADRVFVLVFSCLSHWNISTLGNILVKL